MKIVIRRFLLYFLPAILVFFGNDPFKIVHLFGDVGKDNIFKILIYISGSIISLIIVQYVGEKDKKRIQELSETLENLVKELRNVVEKELERYLLPSRTEGQEGLNLNIRIFLPRKKCNFKKTLFFEMRNYSGLYVSEVEVFCMQVLPIDQKQGLVGKCYHSKKVEFDFELKTNLEKKLYNLTEEQIELTAGSSFAIAAPIFKDATRKEVIAIVTFDSETAVNTPNGNNWKKVIKTYCKLIHKTHKLITKK